MYFFWLKVDKKWRKWMKQVMQQVVSEFHSTQVPQMNFTQNTPNDLYNIMSLPTEYAFSCKPTLVRTTYQHFLRIFLATKYVIFSQKILWMLRKKLISITYFYWVPIVSCSVIPIFHFIFTDDVKNESATTTNEKKKNNMKEWKQW